MTNILLFIRGLFLATVLLILGACSGGSGGGGSNQVANTDQGSAEQEFVYSGPTPGNNEVQSFKNAFYNNLAIDQRCGRCHTPGGEAGSIDFVNRDDVNLAWQSAKARVNLAEPSASALVAKVAGGHQCWLGAAKSKSCAITITAYIEAWARGASSGISLVSLSPRRIKNPDDQVRFFPSELSDAQALGSEVDDLLTLVKNHCSACHNNAVAFPQSPYFASTTSDDIAYQAIKSKVNLTDWAQSRLVSRLANDQHQCWSDDCAADANAMTNAISIFAEKIPATNIDSNLTFSKAQVLEGPDGDGIVASSGGRYEADLIAKWEFREGAGVTVADTSGVRPEIDLSLFGDVTWLGSGGGVRFSGGKAQGGVEASAKLANLIARTGEYTIEAWVAPYNVTQQDAWILGYSGGAASRNLLMSQEIYSYEFYNRSSATDSNGAGEPVVTTDNPTTDFAQASLQHVVMTYDPVVGRKIYVNGVDTGAIDEAGGGVINSWNQSFALTLGNSVGLDRPWEGAMRMMAVHNRKLTEQQIIANNDAGIGKKFYLLFSVADYLPSNNCRSSEADYCYVGFEVSQYDEYSYLFNQPFFVNLNPEPQPLNFSMRGIRLGVNGQLAAVGQSFVNINESIDSDSFVQLNSQLANRGQPLSSQGTIIPLVTGAEQDVFFLSFDQINGNNSIVSDGTVGAFAYSLIGEQSPDIAMRTFDAINQSFAEVTGVANPQSAPAGSAFSALKSQLPTVAAFNAYLASHQMAVTQLAAVYCDSLMQSTTLKAALFPGFVFNRSSSSVLTNEWRTSIVEPLRDRFLNTGLYDAEPGMSAIANIENEVVDLITSTEIVGTGAGSKRKGLQWCDSAGGSCPEARTNDVVKGACIAVLASGAQLIH